VVRLQAPLQLAVVLLGDVGLDVALLVDLTALDHAVLTPDPLRGRVQGLGAVEYQEQRLARVQAPCLQGNCCQLPAGRDPIGLGPHRRLPRHLDVMDPGRNEERIHDVPARLKLRCADADVHLPLRFGKGLATVDVELRLIVFG
jgi:hypothetical protein